MKWTNYFDEIYLVNLPENTDRLKSATAELNKYDIPFTVWPAIKKENGKEGLNLTMISLFKNALHKNHQRILVFEDDLKFVKDPNIIMPRCVYQLGKIFWDLFYLGINMDNAQNLFTRFVDTNILGIEFGYATHAVAYNRNMIIYLQDIISRYMTRKPDFPYDSILTNIIHKNYNCFSSYPMLVTQVDGWSDIEKSNLTYEYIQQRYDHSVKHLLDDNGLPKL
jgi:GR25 family glycosyltransferase involved in LPS biosynthesis